MFKSSLSGYQPAGNRSVSRWNGDEGSLCPSKILTPNPLPNRTAYGRGANDAAFAIQPTYQPAIPLSICRASSGVGERLAERRWSLISRCCGYVASVAVNISVDGRRRC
jgi:hypothetical protein